MAYFSREEEAQIAEMMALAAQGCDRAWEVHQGRERAALFRAHGAPLWGTVTDREADLMEEALRRRLVSGGPK